MTAPQAPAVALPVPTVLDTGIATRVAEMRWKLAIVAPALVHRKGSRARAAVIREIAARSHPGMNGTPVAIAADTLRDWLAKIENGREFNLARPRRNDAGKRRGFVCRAWDSACPLPESEKAAIAAAFDAHVRSLWRSGMPQGKVLALAATELQKLSIESGWQDAPIIPPGLHAVKRHFNMRKLAIKETDAKRFHDLFTPRIHRSRDSLQPMDIVIGDVHPVDILITRDDGSQAIKPDEMGYDKITGNDVGCGLEERRALIAKLQAEIAALHERRTDLAGKLQALGYHVSITLKH